MKNTPSVLVAIASYGTAQDHFLERVIAEYKKLNMPCKVVVLSNVNKPVKGAEVVVGLPSPNPYSLPFAHRKVFADNLGKYDYFIYAEDDTLLTEKSIEAFMALQPELEDGEILGFLRSETSPEGKKYITTIHHLFRWLPSTVVKRGKEIFAQFSNQHSGCFIASRKQLARAIASGGFLVKPRSEYYGMLETAASDIYTQCGLRRLICISKVKDFIVPHLANKYFSQMGIPEEELEFQVQTLVGLHQNGRWQGAQFNPQTEAPEFRWSKNLYEKGEEELLKTIPASTKRLLSIGAASGENEIALAGKGMEVWALPLDSVFADMLGRRGIHTIEGPFERVVKELEGEKFDAILIADALHLVEEPIDWLQKTRKLLPTGGHVIGSVGNTTDLLSWLKDWREGRRRSLYPDKKWGVQPTSERKLRKWLQISGFEVLQITPVITSSRNLVRRLGTGPLKSRLASKFIFKARKKLPQRGKDV